MRRTGSPLLNAVANDSFPARSDARTAGVRCGIAIFEIGGLEWCWRNFDGCG